jgi:hypothetical protein
MFNRDKLIPPGSGITVSMPVNINDHGVIAAWGLVNGFEIHAVLLIPK